MRRDWGHAEAQNGKWSDESPLSVERLAEIMRRIAGSPAAAQWVATFADWMKDEPQLGGIAALGLAELCTLDDSRVGDLTRAIAAHPTDASQKALTEFINHRKRRERPGPGVGTA